ncbi:hypothetical protein D3C73_1491310 [compost metagenome]
MIGYCVPWLSWPLASEATPFVSVVRAGALVDTMKWLSSFHEPWNDRITIVTSAGVAIGRTTDQNSRNVPAPSMRACSSTETGIDSKKFFMMKTPAASTSSGRIIPA